MLPRLEDETFITDMSKREDAGPFVCTVGAGRVHLRLNVLLKVRFHRVATACSSVWLARKTGPGPALTLSHHLTLRSHRIAPPLRKTFAEHLELLRLSQEIELVVWVLMCRHRARMLPCRTLCTSATKVERVWLSP